MGVQAVVTSIASDVTVLNNPYKLYAMQYTGSALMWIIPGDTLSCVYVTMGMDRKRVEDVDLDVVFAEVGNEHLEHSSSKIA